MIDGIKKCLFPKVDREVLKNIDEESISSIYLLSLIVVIFELITIVFFLISGKPFDHAARVGIGSVLFCTAVCLSGRIVSGIMLKREQVSHLVVMAFKICYFLIMSIWAIWVSYRHYINGQQLFTFFTVELIMVCFIPFRPWISALLSVSVYTALYIMLYSISGAMGIHFLNFLVLVLVSITVMIVRYHSQIRIAEKAIQLKNSNDLLEYANRHDALTGLRNRKALDEDGSKVIGKHVVAHMIDINDFKKINDSYGHTVGDDVLKETALRLKELFPKDRCYRYGGDEFLVLSTENETYCEDIYQFSSAAIPNSNILLSIGHASGDPEDHNRLFELIKAADVRLYEIKRKMHSPEYGGYDRRRSIQSDMEVIHR